MSTLEESSRHSVLRQQRKERTINERSLIGYFEGGMSRADLKEIGEMLDESEAALIVVGEATIERAIEEETKRRKKMLKKEVRTEAREIERAIDAA